MPRGMASASALNDGSQLQVFPIALYSDLFDPLRIQDTHGVFDFFDVEPAELLVNGSLPLYVRGTCQTALIPAAWSGYASSPKRAHGV